MNAEATATLKNARISTKQSIELCAFIRGKKVEAVRTILQKAIALERAIPFKRFTNGLGHKPGMAAGRYIPTTAKTVLGLLHAVVANAEQKGIAGDLVILHASARQGTKQYHHGRQRRSVMKATHLTIGVGQQKEPPAQEKA